MRPSRVFRLLFRIFILILSLSVTILSVLVAPFSALELLGDFDNNIGWNIDNAVYNIEINETTFEIEEFDFILPMYINNTGYFDIEHLELTISIEMNYSHVDYTTPGVNTTRQIEILRNEQNFGTIPEGTIRYFNFTADINNFYNATFPDFSEIDFTRGPPAIIFYATIILSLDYTLGLHSITLGINNVEIGEI